MITRIALLALFAFTLQVNADVFPKVVSASFHTGYMPVGFDTNDNVQLVAEGAFSSTCYKPASVKAVVSHQNKTIHVYPRTYKYDGACLQMMVPWHKEIDLGLLEAGTYKVINVNGTQQKELGDLQVVATSSSSPDDYLYAPVDQAYFEKHEDRYFIRISGEFPQTCFKMRDVIVRAQEKVLVVQPIAEQTSELCEARPLPYSQLVEVKDLKPGRYLIHVRSLNGRAVNNLVDAL